MKLLILLTILQTFYCLPYIGSKVTNFSSIIETLDSKILSFGDYNNDRHTDIFTHTIHENTDSLYVYIYNSKDKIYKKKLLLEFNYLKIKSVATFDFNNDGLNDLLLYGNLNNGDNITKIYIQNKSTKLLNSIKEFTSDSEPNIIDFYGNNRISLLYSVNGIAYVMVMDKTGAFKESKISLDGKFYKYNSNAFIDVNGDLRTDLVTVTRENENADIKINIFIAENDEQTFNKTKPTKSFIIKNHDIGYISFADFDGDGSIDMLIPVLDGESDESSIHIFFDKQSEINKPGEPFQNWFMFNEDLLTTEESKHKIFNVPNNKIRNGYIRVRYGDINLDGINDLIIPYKDGKIGIWIMDNNAEPKYLKGDHTGIKDIDNIEDATLYDYRDIGLLDMVLITSSGKSIIIENDHIKNRFFIKVYGIKGINKDHEENGDSNVGLNVMVELTDSNNNKHRFVSTQFSQTSEGALQLPYVLIGLDVSTRKINKLLMGLHHVGESQHYKEKKEIISNSVLFLTVYNSSPQNWKLQLWIDRSSTLLYIGIGLSTVIFLFSLLLMCIHFKEKKKQEKKLKANLYTF